MTAGELLAQTIAALAGAGVEDAGFDALQLIGRRTGMTPAVLRADRDRPVAPLAARQVRQDAARRCAGEPLQYILGEWEFYSMPFAVGPGVLIPRPDTEILVDEALRLLEGKTTPRVADLCAGSGCVGIAIAHQRPDARVTCVEASPAAAAYLKQNREKNHTQNVSLRLADVLAGPPREERYDLIVSNPPYIPSAELPALSAEVRQEPAMALDGGADGLTFYRGILAAWCSALAPHGGVAFEVGIHQDRAVADLLARRFEQVYTTPDLNGIPRVLMGVALKQ